MKGRKHCHRQKGNQRNEKMFPEKTENVSKGKEKKAWVVRGEELSIRRAR